MIICWVIHEIQRLVGGEDKDVRPMGVEPVLVVEDDLAFLFLFKGNHSGIPFFLNFTFENTL